MKSTPRFVLSSAALWLIPLAGWAQSPAPVAHWSFDQPKGGGFVGAGPAAVPIFFSGTVESVPGRLGKAVGLIESPLGHLVLTSSYKFFPPKGFTIEFWLNPLGKSSSYGTCFDLGSHRGVTVRLNPAGRISLSTAAKWNAITLSEPLVEQKWVHVAVTCTPDLATFYVGGVAVGQVPLLEPLKLDGDIQLGSVTETSKSADGVYTENRVKPLLGDLDELKIYDRVLTPAEIARAAR